MEGLKTYIILRAHPARLSRVGSHIANHASFDPRNYGYSRLSDLVEAVGLFELKRDDGKHFIIRNGRK
ncbi:MAG TPA: hypothetical protein ENI94_05510 [Gammaproteobacteria bacterium]|nr:hypothetical protein [Gammaproteobacteria bacterium]